MKIFLDFSPGFYKKKLFNEINKNIDILVIYTSSYDKKSRNQDFMSGSVTYKYFDLKGSTFKQILFILKILVSYEYEEVVVGGYDSIFCWLPLIVRKKVLRSAMIESTYRETVRSGPKFFLKRLFFKNLDKVYVPGIAHEKLVKLFGFNGQIQRCNSVGLINLVQQPEFMEKRAVKNFLYVGRLIPVKNLDWLLSHFVRHQELHLDVIGFGELEECLKSKYQSENISFLGAINNTDLSMYYQASDVLILPSLKETWGVVVEEALNNGIPVMISDMVGCADDLVLNKNTGVIFKTNNTEDFEKKLKQITDIKTYNSMRKTISKINYQEIETSVIYSFTK